jgi:hypothetical protein
MFLPIIASDKGSNCKKPKITTTLIVTARSSKILPKKILFSDSPLINPVNFKATANEIIEKNNVSNIAGIREIAVVSLITIFLNL